MVTIDSTEQNGWHGLFEHSPVSLWLEDYSGVKAYLDELRAKGVTDLRSYGTEHPEAIDTCLGRIVVSDVNERTLELFKAKSKAQLFENLSRVFRDEMRRHFVDELAGMWQGKLAFEGEGINYALTGEPIDIYLRWSILPGYETTWERALISIVDITERKKAERALQASEAHARGLFDHSPISLWVEDYSGIKTLLDGLHQEGLADFDLYLRDNPGFVTTCMSKIQVLDVNDYSLKLFGAKSKEELLSNLGQVFRDEMNKHFALELTSMWQGDLLFEGEGINYSLNGEPVDIFLRWAVMPGYERTWERTLVSIIDITARKKAEAYLKYLGTHDVLTGLYNRAYFEEEIRRLERSRQFPISVLAADLNGLKPTNDTLGHEAGDALLRRAAEVLKAAFRAEDVVARMGGDEFVALMPLTDGRAAEKALQRVQRLIEMNNQYYYQGSALSISLGIATADTAQDLRAGLRAADDQMYVAKRQYHRQQGQNR
jgi:diguanylate cyclase (GGDEF)-like protein